MALAMAQTASGCVPWLAGTRSGVILAATVMMTPLCGPQ